MFRKLLISLFLMLTVGGASLLPSSVEAQSSGCGSVGGLTGWVSEFDSVNTGSQPFVAGETINVSGDDVFDFTVSGTASFSSNGTSASYTIPQDGNYTITVAKNSDGDLALNASCSGGSNGGGGGGIYNTYAFSIYDRGNGVYHVWGDCAGDECQLVAIVDLNQAVVSPTQFQDYGGTWFVDVHHIEDDGQNIVFQFNVYNGGILHDDGFRVRFPKSNNANTPPSDDPDGDGFVGNDDYCPQVAGTLTGCPDRDGDRIFDFYDDCPDVAAPNGVRGCPDTDEDGDNVLDELDECLGVAGSVIANGCPDRDEDGVVDDEDDCPDTLGLVILNGCAPRQSVSTEPLITVEILVPEEQCFFISINARAPYDRWPETTNGNQSAGGEFTLRSEDGTEVITQAWGSKIGLDGYMYYGEHVSVPAGLPLGSYVDVIFLEDVVEGEEPFTVTDTRVALKAPDCGPILSDGPLTLFQYAEINGSFDNTTIDTVGACGLAFTTVYGVPVMKEPHTTCLGD